MNLANHGLIIPAALYLLADDALCYYKFNFFHQTYKTAMLILFSCVLAKEFGCQAQRRRDHLPPWCPLPDTRRDRVIAEDGQRIHFSQRLHHEEQSLRQRHIDSTLVSQSSPHFHLLTPAIICNLHNSLLFLSAFLC